MSQKARQALLKSYDDSALDHERPREHWLITDFIRHRDVEEIEAYDNEDPGGQTLLFRVNRRFLLFDYYYGSCYGCSEDIESRITAKMKEEIGEDSDDEDLGWENGVKKRKREPMDDETYHAMLKKYARGVIEEMVDDMVFFESREEAMKHYATQRSRFEYHNSEEGDGGDEDRE
jgi:hypothetical protein